MYGKEVKEMPIVKYKNQSGAVYAYDQTSVYDARKKQSRPVRKYLGRVDPETGEIISTKGKRGRPKKQAGDETGPEKKEKDYKALYENVAKELDQARKELAAVTRQKELLEKQAEELMQMLRSIRGQISSVKGI